MGRAKLSKLDSKGNLDPIDFEHPSMPGQTIILLSTGLGSINGEPGASDCRPAQGPECE